MVHLILAVSNFTAMAGSKRSKYFLSLSFFILFFFAALRYMYGNDYSNYYYTFLDTKSGFNWFRSEPFYVLLIKIMPSFYLLIAVTSAAFLYCVYQLIKETMDTRYAWMGLLIFTVNPYLFLMNLSAIRQSIAMVFFIIAVHFAVKRKLIPYIILIICGGMFHKSAYILFPLWFILNEKTINKKRVCIILLILFVLLFGIDIDTHVVQVAAILNDNNYLSYMSDGTGNSLRATLLTSVYFVYVLGNMPKLKGKILIYSKIYLVGLILGILAYHVAMLTRIQMYFDIFSVVVLPSIFIQNWNKGVTRIKHGDILGAVWEISNRYVLPLMIISIYFLRYYSFFTNPMWEPFVKYQTILTALLEG